MITTIERNQVTGINETKDYFGFNALATKYLDYVDRQEGKKVYWYMLAVMTIPTVMMIPFVIAMWMMLPSFENFVGIAMMLFFANVSVHVVDMKSRVYMPLFHMTILLFIAIPLITYFIIN